MTFIGEVRDAHIKRQELITLSYIYWWVVMLILRGRNCLPVATFIGEVRDSHIKSQEQITLSDIYWWGP